MAESFAVVFVSRAELRQIFNRGRYHQRAEAGRLRIEVRTDGHPSQPRALEPYCTRSQYIAYFDVSTGEKLAEAHRYLRVDRTLGASGRPDPKRIWRRGTVHAVE